MPSQKRRIAVTAATGLLALAVLGASASPAGAVSVQLTTGLNSPQGTNTVQAPDAATPGAINAATQVISKGPGTLQNIQFVVSP